MRNFWLNEKFHVSCGILDKLNEEFWVKYGIMWNFI